MAYSIGSEVTKFGCENEKNIHLVLKNSSKMRYYLSNLWTNISGKNE
jgi:hypothetical protein